MYIEHWFISEQYQAHYQVYTLYQTTKSSGSHPLNISDNLSHDVASWSEIASCIKINKTLVVYRFSDNVIK